MLKQIWLKTGILIFGLAVQCVSAQTTYTSKWDRVQSAAQSLQDGTIASRMFLKDEILDILLAEEEDYPIFYVDQNATGLNNGSSWEDAFTTIQPAIELATTGEGWVWVAQGEYTGQAMGMDGGHYIVLAAVRIKPRVMLFGGFKGTEISLEERDPMANRTIIHGEISVLGPRAVYMEHETVLDGFEIRRSGFVNYSGEAVYSSGGGVRSGNWLAVIRNNIIYENFGRGGAGLAVWNRDNEYNVEGFVPIIERNQIYDNCGLCGAGVQLRQTEALFCNNIVMDNWHEERSKGVEVIITPAHSDPPVIVNSILYGNSSTVFPDLYNHFDFVDLYGDAAKAVGGYNCIETGGEYTPGNITDNPMFVNRNGRDYRLRGDSPCIDTGLPAGPLDPDGTRADIGIFFMKYLDIGGTVNFWGQGPAIPTVRVNWDEMGRRVTATDQNGQYSWGQAIYGTSVTLSCAMDAESNEGSRYLSAFDAALVARHCLELDTLENYALLAADVDENGIVNLKDASWIGRSAVGLSDILQAPVLSWRFDPQSRHFERLTESLAEQNYSAYLLGDVNGSWAAAAQTSKLASETSLFYQVDKCDDGWLVTVLGNASVPLLSMDLHVAFDARVLTLESVTNADVTSRFFLQHNLAQEGLCKIALYGVEPVMTAGALLTLKFSAREAGDWQTVIEWPYWAVNDEAGSAETLYLTDVPDENRTPLQFELRGNYPNPFNPATMLTFAIEQAGQVQLEIYNAAGRQIRILASDIYPAGVHHMTWDGRDDAGWEAPSGVYICRLRSGEHSAVKKMLKIK